MIETKYGKYFVRKPVFPELAHAAEVSAGKEVTGKSKGAVFMDKNLVASSNSTLMFMWIFEIPHPNPTVVKHSHPYDELLFFVGTNPDDPQDLGGEIEVEMGDEKHVIDTTTSVFVPKGLEHTFICKRVSRPQIMIAFYLHGEYK